MELIDREPLVRALTTIDRLARSDAQAALLGRVFYIVSKQPTVDAASIVRCKDCKNWDSSTEGRYVGGWCFCEKLQFSTSPDWFCADGVREQNGTPE